MAAPSASPERFDEDVRWFRARIPMTDPEWRVLEYRARRKAFWVAGVAQLDVVVDVWEAIDRALVQGTTYNEFREQVIERLTRAWGGIEPPGRVEVIFRTNVQLAYQAGRWRQLRSPAVLTSHPYWMFDAVLDVRTSEICRARHGVTLPANHQWWRSNYPPLHFNCRSGVRAVTEEEYARIPGERKLPPTGADVPQEGFGFTPDLQEWMPDPTRYPPELWAMLERKIATL